MSKYGSFRYATWFHCHNIKRAFIELLRSLKTIIFSVFALITMPLWWIPVNIFLKIMEPYQNEKIMKARNDHMDRMIPAGKA